MNGNKSSVDDYLLMCRRYEAAVRGAGRMLSDGVHSTLQAEFAEDDIGSVSQADMTCDVVRETCDVELWLARFDIDSATVRDHKTFQMDCDDAISAIQNVQARSRARQRRLEITRKANLSPVRRTA